MSKLVLIDGNAIMHRAFHALPSNLTSKSGEPINAVYGFVSMLLRLIEDLDPTHIAVAFDRPEPTFRNKAFTKYQSQRPEIDKDLLSQFAIVRKVIDSFGIHAFDKAGYEADDIIGTLSQSAIVPQNRKSKIKNKKSIINEVIIVTGDRDQLQLVNDKVKVYMPVNGLSKGVLLDEKGVVEKMGVKASQIIDYKALVGDQSDNYPGISGIGPVTATKLLNQYKSYEKVIANLDKLPKTLAQKIETNKKDGDLSYMLARIVTDVPINVNFDDLNKWEMGNDKSIKLFEEIGFKTLTRRIRGEKDLSVNKKPTLDQIKKVVVKISKTLKGKQYAVRGTASLVLQGLDMGVDDIDLLCDKDTAELCNQLFDKYLVEKIEYKESDKFKSYFGKLVIDEIQVEVMGEWQIKLGQRIEEIGQNWSKVYNAEEEEIITIEINGKKVRVTKIEVELEVSAAMGRWSEFHKIKKQIDGKNQPSLF